MLGTEHYFRAGGHPGLGPEMIQNGTESYHLEHLHDLRPERVQNDTRTNNLKHLSGLGPEMIQNDTETDNLVHLSGLAPESIKCHRNLPFAASGQP